VSQDERVQALLNLADMEEKEDDDWKNLVILEGGEESHWLF